MKTTTPNVCFVAMTLLASPACAETQPVCPDQKAGNAIDAWQRSTEAFVVDNVQQSVIRQFCEANAEVLSEGIASPETVAATIDTVIAKYLDRSADPSKPGRSMGAELRSGLGHQGFSRPIPKRWAFLHVSYSKKVEHLEVDGERASAVKKILVRAGDVTIKGYLSSVIVCSDTVTVAIHKINSFQC